MDDGGANESTPLLGSHEANSLLPRPSPSSRSEVAKNVPGVRRTILVVATIQVVLNIGSFISFAAQLAILQDIVCKSYYNEHLPSFEVKDRCLVDAVQSEVSLINGWKDVFEMLPAIVLAVPYGALADRIGRKKVFLLAIIGIAMNDLCIRIVFWFHDIFPVRAIWLGGLWQIVGAGAASLSSISHVMVADVCPTDQRTTAFSQLQSAIMIAQFLFVPVGGALVSINPWIPMFISSAVTMLGFLGALFLLPETLVVTKSRVHDEPALDRHNHHPTEHAHDAATSKLSLPNCHWQGIRHGRIRLTQWVGGNSRLVFVLACFFPCSIGQQAGGTLLMQFASKRLGWSLAESSYLISLGAAINLIVHAFGIPILSSFLLWHLDLHEMVKDKRLAQISGLFLVLGTASAFAAGSWEVLVSGQVLTSMGLAFVVPARSLVTSMVAQKHLAALYTTISVLLYGGMLTGGPLLASAFRWGLHRGEAWLGMPFLVACICFALALLSVSSAPNTPIGPYASDQEDEVGADPSEP